jgi:TonB-linked SusC/RagA family outer membrane protein
VGPLLAVPALAQQPRPITGRVTNEFDAPMAGVQVGVKGTTIGMVTRDDGTYSVRATSGQIIVFRLIGYEPLERPVGPGDVINVQMRKVALALDQVVITALGETKVQRALGTAQQTVEGAAIVQTQRTNFVNALAGRVAGVDVTSTSGVPGASTSITIRGVSSLSSSNQPLMIVDGLPLDNKTMLTDVLAADAPGSLTAFSNRGLDFTNRAADINPDDIESVVVLKGPEAAALYGIDAANGAIVITTKRGKPGQGGFEYYSNFKIESVASTPEVQRVYGPTSLTGGLITSLSYFGAPYAAGTTFYDNVDGFFRTAVTQRHSLAFSGASPDNDLNYRLGVAVDRQVGVIPGSDLDKFNLSGSSQAEVKPWLRTDLSFIFANVTNNQVLKGSGGPLIGLLSWPATDDARNYLTAAGTRRRITAASQTGEIDNPFFSVNRNLNNSRNTRLMFNVGLVVTPFKWGELKTNMGVDGYTNENLILRHPESTTGFTNNGILDLANDVTRTISTQTLLNFTPRQLTTDLSLSGVVGHAMTDFKSSVEAQQGMNFLDPNFVSMNNTVSKFTRTTINRRRLVSAFGSLSLDYKKYLFLNVTGRNDWTSTIPVVRNSFFYPGVNGSFIFSDAFPSIARYVQGKIRAGYAQVGRDARPYAYRPALESKATTFGGYGYGFWGPNLDLRPEFARSYEVGTELSFLDDRLGADVNWFKKKTEDQITNDIRGSYGTGFILFNLNGASTENTGWEVTLRGTPILKRDFSWDVQANFTRLRGKVLSLPNNVPEAYNAYTWLYGNVRNGAMPGQSTMALTGWFYQRVTADSGHKGDLLIDPTTGLPIQSSTFIDRGYDRQPEWTMGVGNTLRWHRWSLDFLLDFRKGGDVFNATEHYLTARGLSMRTLDRETPRVVKGVLRDGKENTANPTINTIVVIPAVQNNYYTAISEELFIEQDINWIRLRDVTLRYALPDNFFPGARNSSAYITVTDPWMVTNYSGLDPIVNGNSAAVGGSSGVGIDYGNFPVPRGISFGIKMSF